MPLVFARLRGLSHFYFCDTPVMAAIFCYSGDTAFAAPNTLPLLLFLRLRWTVPPQTYGQQVHPRTLRGQQRVMFKGIHTLDTIKGIKGQ